MNKMNYEKVQKCDGLQMSPKVQTRSTSAPLPQKRTYVLQILKKMGWLSEIPSQAKDTSLNETMKAVRKTDAYLDVVKIMYFLLL